MANELNKTLSITIDTKLTGEESFSKLKNAIDSSDTSIKKFTSSLYTAEDGTDAYIHRIELVGKSLAKLKTDFAAIQPALQGTGTIGSLTSNALTEELDKYKQLSNLFRTQSRTRIQELTSQLNLEKSIRVNGLNDIKTKILQAAQQEQEIKQNLNYKLLTIEESLRQGIITSVRQAEQARIDAVKQAAIEITRIREDVERRQAAIARREVKVDNFRKETDERIRELDRQLALEQARRVNGAQSRQALELEAADKEYRIRKNLADRLIQIDESIKRGVAAGRDPNTGRFLNADTARAQALAKAYREIDQVNKDLANSTNLAANSHSHLAFRVLELIGLYKLWTGVINGVYNSITSIPKVGIELDTTRAALASTIGTYEAGVGVLNALEREAQRTGIAIGTLRENFRNFSASTTLAGESLDTTWRIFTDINTVITALHLPAEKAQLTFLALSQVFNKTKVQSEELVKQLGNLLPGAFTAFFEANKKVEKTLTDGTKIWEGSFKDRMDMIKQMANGTVFAHETMLNFANFMAERFIVAFNVASDGLNANLGRLETQITLLKEALYDLTSSRMNEIVKGLTRFATALRESAETGGTLITVIKGVTYILTAGLIVGIGTLLARLGPVQGLVNGVIASFRALSTSGFAVAGILPAISAGLAGLASSPALLATLASTAVITVMNYKTEAQRTVEDIFTSIQAAKDAVEEFRNQQKKDEGLEIDIEQNREVIKARKRLEAAQQLANKSLFDKIFDNLVIGATQGTEALYLFKQQTKAATDNIQVLQENLDKTREKATIQVKFETENALQDLSNITEKLEIQMLRATGRVDEANKLQFEASNRESKAALEAEIAKYQSFFKDAEGRPIPYTPTAALTARVNNAVKGLEYYNTILNTTKASSTSLSNEITRQNKLLEQKTIEITNTYDREITKIKQKQEELQFNQNNPSLGKSLARSDFNKAILDFTKQIELLEQRKTNELIKQNREVEKNLILLEQQNQKAKASQAEIIRAVRLTETGATSGTDVKNGTIGINGGRGAAAIGDGGKAFGAMQVHLEAWIDTGRKATDFAKASLQELDQAGQEYLIKQLERFKDVQVALAAYNQGPTKVQSIYERLGIDIGTEDPEVLKRVKANFDQKMKQYVETVFSKLPASRISNEEISRQNEINKLEEERIKIQLEGQNRLRQLSREQVVDLIQYRDTINDVNIKTLEVQGRIAEATELRVAKEQEILRLRLAQEVKKGDKSAEKALKQLDDLKRIEVIQGRLNQLQNNTNLLTQRYQLELQNVQELVQSGYYTQQQGALLTANIYKNQINLIYEQIRAVRELVKEKGASLATDQKLLDLQQQLNAIQPSGTVQQLNRSGIPNFFTDFQDTKAKLAEDYTIEEAKLKSQYFDLYGFSFTAHQDYIEKKVALDRQYTSGTFNLHTNMYKGIFGTASQTFADITTAMQKMYGEQSKQARMAFAAFKAFRIAETVMNTAQGIMNVWATAGNPYVAAALTGVVAALGAVQVATIASQQMPAAHGGMDYIPKEQTYVLDKGERVLSPNQNKDLTNFLKQDKIRETEPKEQKNNVKILNIVDKSLIIEAMQSPEGEQVVMNHIRSNQ